MKYDRNIFFEIRNINVIMDEDFHLLFCQIQNIYLFKTVNH